MMNFQHPISTDRFFDFIRDSLMKQYKTPGLGWDVLFTSKEFVDRVWTLYYSCFVIGESKLPSTVVREVAQAFSLTKETSNKQEKYGEYGEYGE